MDEAWCRVRLLQPKLVFNLADPINGVSHHISRCQTFGLVAKYNEFIRERVDFWMRRKCLGLNRPKGIITTCF